MISIICPTFNSEKTIQKTLDSIRNQTLKKIELIIIDGLSTDSTITRRFLTFLGLHNCICSDDFRLGSIIIFSLLFQYIKNYSFFILIYLVKLY